MSGGSVPVPARKRALALLAIGLTTIFWGLSFISIKVAVEVFPPMTLAAARFILASLLLFVFHAKREPSFRIERSDLPGFIVSGLLGITLYFFCENNGVKLISPSEAAIIVAGIPVLSTLADTIIYRNPLSPAKVVGVVMSVLGVYLVVRHGLDAKGSPIVGYLFMLGAVVAWVLYNFRTRPLFNRYSQLGIVSRQMIYGTIAFLPFLLFELQSIQWHRVSLVILLHVLYLGVFCSALAYTLYIYALDHLGVVTTSLFINLVPVVTVVFGTVFLDESIGLAQIAGGLLVLVSVSLVSLSRRRR
jgi:drug/metabolite transporter (DMT)-like permease